MTTIRRILLLVAMLLASNEARAQGTSPPPKPNPTVLGGWSVVVVSVLIGGTVTGISLAKQCPSGVDTECGRWTSLGIWTGIGIASLGSVAGLLVVEVGSSTPRVSVVCRF
jgi:hypothetical protein